MQPFLILIVAFLLFFYCLDLMIEILNLRAMSRTLPDEFKGFYSEEKYKESQEYLSVNTEFQIIQNTVVLGATLLFIFMGGFNAIDIWARHYGYGEIITGLLFMAGLGMLSFLLGIPFSLYQTFIIEEKFGFNKMTWNVYVLDLIKSVLVGVLLGAPILMLILAFFLYFGSYAWLYAWLGVIVIQLLLLFLAPAVIMPIFNKFTPLTDGELKQKIEAFAKAQNFIVSGLFTMDGSKRSTKANAFFTGFGRFRRIVLFDTLIAKHSVDELVAILAHEIGHYKLRHIFKTLTFSVLSTGCMFYFLSRLINNENLFSAMGMAHVSTYASLVFIAFLYTPVSKVFSIIAYYLSRKHEYEADSYAARTVGNSEILVIALKKLSVENLSNLTPHPWKVFLEYSHPPILKRVTTLRTVS